MKKLIVIIFLNAVLSQNASSVEETGKYCIPPISSDLTKTFSRISERCEKGDIMYLFGYHRWGVVEVSMAACVHGTIKNLSAGMGHKKDFKSQLSCIYRGEFREERTYAK